MLRVSSMREIVLPCQYVSKAGSYSRRKNGSEMNGKTLGLKGPSENNILLTRMVLFYN
jgi:hypothetical protein